MKIGILSGTFDPVHAGHISFVNEAMRKFKLDRVLFLVERSPRRKQSVSGFGHRLKMLKLALAGQADLKLFDSGEDFLTLGQTLPKIKAKYQNTHFVIMVGSDVGRYLGDWRGIDELKTDVAFLIAIRGGDSEMSLRDQLNLPAIKAKVKYYYSPKPELSASRIRMGLAKSGIPAVDNYIADHRLYS